MELLNHRRRFERRRAQARGCGLSFAAAALLLFAAGPAAAGNLVQVRVGNHPTYTRVVFEFDAPTGYRIERKASGESENTIVVTLQAASRPRNIASKSQGVESVVVEPVAGEAVARIQTRDMGLSIREMILADPPRVVLDLLLPESARAETASKPAAEPAPEPAAEPAQPALAEVEAPEAPVAVTEPVEEPAIAEETPEKQELAPEPIVAVVEEVEIAPEPEEIATPATPAETVDEGETEVVAEATAPPVPDAAADPADSVDDPTAVADELAGLEKLDYIAKAKAAKAKHLAALEAATANDSAELDSSGDSRTPAEAPALAGTPAQSGSSPISGLNPLTLGAIAGGALALLLVVFMVLRGRRALPNDMDVTALAEADDAYDERVPAGGFAMDAPVVADTPNQEEDFESAPQGGLDDENKPIETVQSSSSGAGLFDDSPEEKEETTMQDQDLSMTQGASDAQTHLGVGAGIASMAGDSDVAGLIQELERRMAVMEQRVDEANEARERLERQVSAQSEELRVQRAAIARTQRALRGLNRSEEDQATEPALRDPADSAGRQ